jgi:hypothetical protein
MQPESFLWRIQIVIILQAIIAEHATRISSTSTAAIRSQLELYRLSELPFANAD